MRVARGDANLVVTIGQRDGRPALIEATSNQVNQDGGYTGMTPEDFRRFVRALADKCPGVRENALRISETHFTPEDRKSVV